MTSEARPFHHGLTVVGIAVCTVLVIVATPLVRFFMFSLWDLRGSWWFIPEPVDYYILKVPTELTAAIAAGWLALYLTTVWIKRSDPSVVAYVVSTLYLCLFAGLLIWIYSSGSTPNELLLVIAQLVGTIGGLWGGRTTSLEDR